MLRNLLKLNDKFSSLSPIYKTTETEKYFKLPLSLTSFNRYLIILQDKTKSTNNFLGPM